MLVVSTSIKIAALGSYMFLIMLTVTSDAQQTVRRFFYLYLFGMIYWQFVSLMVNFSTGPERALFWYNLFIPGTGFYSVLFFPFTRAFLGIKRQKVLVWLSYAFLAFLIAVGFAGLTFEGVRMGQAGIYVPLYRPFVYVIGSGGYFFWGAGVFNLIREISRSRSSFQRNRIMYLLLGATFVILGTASNFTPLQDFPIDITFNLINAALIGYAVIRFRLLDIRVFLTRSLVYSLLTGLLVAVYVGLIIVLESLLKNTLGFTSTIAEIFAVLVLALVFLPVRNRVQLLIDKLFFRDKHDYQRVIEQFSRAVNTIRNSDELLNLVCGTVNDAVRANKVFVLLQDQPSGNYRVWQHSDRKDSSYPIIEMSHNDQLVEWLIRSRQPAIQEELKADPALMNLVSGHSDIFEIAEAHVLVPILLPDRLMGILCLGSKRSGAMYNEDDVRFLTTLINQTATALDNALIYMEIERRLSEQMLLFIISDAFKRSIRIDDVLSSIVRILRDFLQVDHCGVAYFERLGSNSSFTNDDITTSVLNHICRLRNELSTYYDGTILDSFSIPPVLEHQIEADSSLSEQVKKLCLSFIYLPLHQQDELFGVLVLQNRDEGRGKENKGEFLRTIRAIVSQGVMLQRTFVNLVSVKSYNENILASMEDMGDTLLIIDLDGKIRSTNRAMCNLLEMDQDDLVGTHVSTIIASGGELFEGDGFRNLLEIGTITNHELSYRKKDGSHVPMLFSGSAMNDEEGHREAIVGIARDITEHIRAEEVRKNLLMIKEIHHRIKNNLQVISSLLYLQSGYVDDPRTKEMFIESQNRVRSMALIHEKLYQSGDLAGIDFGEYLNNLTQNLFLSYGVNTGMVRISVNVDEGIVLDMDTIIPCGLIINELVTNSLKHAFGENQPGEIDVSLKVLPQTGDESDTLRNLKLTVADNGTGFPADLDITSTDSLGLKLVSTLTQQLRGEINLDRTSGARFEIIFAE